MTTAMVDVERVPAKSEKKFVGMKTGWSAVIVVSS